jgi:RNA polymerase sigma-70 factor (ECF subfamily)
MPSSRAARDRALVASVRQGDNRAMQELYGEHHRRIYGLALRLTGNAGDAEDVVQDTFLRAWSNLSRFRGDSTFGTWVYRIAVNLCRDRARRRKPVTEETEIAAPRKNGDDVLAREQLEAALAGLPAGYREIVVMHDVLELGHREIAEVLGIAVGTSKSQLHKARAQLRRQLTREGGQA